MTETTSKYREESQRPTSWHINK